MQHADAGILKAMNRKGDQESLLALIGKIRAKIPDAVIGNEDYFFMQVMSEESSFDDR